MPETTRDYELMVVFAPQLDDQGVATAIERYTNWITAAGGVAAAPNVWGRRTLAYPIKKQTEGVYVQFDFQLPRPRAASSNATCALTNRYCDICSCARMRTDSYQGGTGRVTRTE